MHSNVLLSASIWKSQSSCRQQKPCTNTSGGVPPPARTKCTRLLLDCRAMRRDELLLEMRRRRLVVAEFQAVGAVTRGERFQPSGEVLHLGERRLCRNLHQPGPRRVGALDMPSMAGELAGDVAHLAFGRGDLDV